MQGMGSTTKFFGIDGTFMVLFIYLFYAIYRVIFMARKRGKKSGKNR